MALQKEPPVSPDTIKDWQAVLDSHFPKSDITTHLKIVWVSGDDWVVDGVWQGVERFYLFEMFPPDAMDPYLIFECQDMERPIVRYDSVLQEVTNGDRMVTRLQWDLFRETGYFAKPWWILQGDRGGHQRFLTTFEKQWLHLLDLPTEMPLPGTLPYAPFDNRVLQQILKHDRLRKKGATLMAHKKARTAQWLANQKDLERQFREDIVAFLKDQIGIDEAKDVTKCIRDEAPVTETNYEKLLEEGEERFVETGRFVSPSGS